MPTLERKSPRLKGFDYASSAAYFVTVCTHGREHLFGEIVGGEMRLNEYGDIVWWQWHKSELVREEVFLDAFVIMPNHIHGIVLLQTPDPLISVSDRDAVGTQGLASLHTPKFQRQKRSLSTFVWGFKAAVTQRINRLRNTPGANVWQGRYHDRIIRNERELQSIREYIFNNPTNWDSDEENQP